MVERKVTPVAEKSKPAKTQKSKTEVTSKTKSSYARQYSLKLKSLKPKSRSSSLIEKFDHGGKKENVGENILGQGNNQTFGKFEKAKKYKSLDQVRCSLHKSSETSVAKKVSKVLQQRKNSKILLRANSNHVLLSNVQNSYSSKSQKNDSKHPSSPEIQGAEKSQSFHAIKIVNKARRACKCISVENNKSLINQKPVGVFNVSNKVYRQISDPLKKVNFTDPLWERIQYINGKGFVKTSDADVNKGNLKKPPIISTEVKFENGKNFCSFDPFARKSEPFYQVVDPGKNSNEQPRQVALSDGKPMKICHCLHFHTEDGFRQFSLQNEASAQEIGQKLFRVNYVSKNDEENKKSDSKENFTDKDTITENIKISSNNLRLKKIPKHSVTKKLSTRSNISNTSIKTSIGKIDSRKKIRKKVSNSDSPEASSLFEWDENPRRISDERKLSKTRTAIFPNVLTDMTTKSLTEQDEMRKGEKSSLLSNEAPCEGNEYKKAKEELEILKKLFTKLNSMDCSSFKEEMAGQQKKQPIDKNSPKTFCRKWRGSQVLAEKACQMLKDIEAEEEYLKEKNKLRHKIIRHVQNFIKLEFSEN